MGTQFFSHLSDDLEHLESYHIIENEMSKYKTLNHESIKWEEVYRHSLEILQNHSMDIKLCNHFILSCIVLNNAESFGEMSALLDFLSKTLRDSPNNLCKNDNDLKSKKRQLKNAIEHFLAESNRLNIPHPIANDLNRTFKLLAESLECNFKEILITQQEVKPAQSTEKHNATNTHNINLNSLNDREYRTFFINLAESLLENDESNLNAYAVFTEAMWGKIKTLPTHNNNITQLRFPDENLIKTLLNINDDSGENIKYFMSNLTLNPFWIEGVKIFCEFLEKHNKPNHSNALRVLTKNFLLKFKEISHLKFENGESLCKEQVMNYFLQQEDTSYIKPKAKNKQQNIDEILLDINAQNHSDSAFCNVNALLKIARIFEEKNMPNNAKMLYKQLKEIMEKMLLKDYLCEEYKEIKVKSEKK